jgi:DNA-binding PucR family transcriptional regulator
VYTTYHCGQNAVWAYWMRTAFSLSSDPAVLRQAPEAGSRSLAGFVEDMVAALSEQLRRERTELARSSHAGRFEVVSLVLESAPITTGRASTGLGYDLRRRHTAAVLWTDPGRPDQAALAQAADAGYLGATSVPSGWHGGHGRIGFHEPDRVRCACASVICGSAGDRGVTPQPRPDGRCGWASARRC